MGCACSWHWGYSYKILEKKYLEKIHSEDRDGRKNDLIWIMRTGDGYSWLRIMSSDLV
jgi:hypothetical protein